MRGADKGREGMIRIKSVRDRVGKRRRKQRRDEKMEGWKKRGDGGEWEERR